MDLYKAIDRLKPKLKTVIILRFFEDKSLSEILTWTDYHDEIENSQRDIIKYGKANGYTFKRIIEDIPMITQKIAN